jgi:NAD(P)-dependent dehydrogenase (short-subunit alcohol dehydrogenase family)
MKAQRIEGAIALMTGANRGIGRATRELALPKSSSREVAGAILDAIEAGQEDIFPDAFAVDFGRRFQSSPKASARQIAAMTEAMVSGSAA